MHTNLRSAGTLSAVIRSLFRSIASEGGSGALNRMTELRPIVRRAQDVLRERFKAGSSAEDYLCERTRLADSVVMGLLHLASTTSAIRDRSMVAPLTAIAVGDYGRCELSNDFRLALLFLLPEYGGGRPARIALTETRVRCVVAGLWDLGFAVDHTARSTSQYLELARKDTTVLAGLIDRQFLWGGFGLFTSLSVGIKAILSERDGARSAG